MTLLTEQVSIYKVKPMNDCSLKLEFKGCLHMQNLCHNAWYMHFILRLFIT